MKNGVPTGYTEKNSGYTDKAKYRYKKKTVRDWQKKIIMQQQRMLYYIDDNWGDPMYEFI